MENSIVFKARNWLMKPFLQQCGFVDYIDDKADIRIMYDSDKKTLFDCMFNELDVKGFSIPETDDIMSRNVDNQHVRAKLVAYYILSNYDDFRNDRELYQVIAESNDFNTDEDFTEEDLIDIARERRYIEA
jgi:hypothetical protein